MKHTKKIVRLLPIIFIIFLVVGLIRKNIREQSEELAKIGKQLNLSDPTWEKVGLHFSCVMLRHGRSRMEVEHDIRFFAQVQGGFADLQKGVIYYFHNANVSHWMDKLDFGFAFVVDYDDEMHLIHAYSARQSGLLGSGDGAIYKEIICQNQ
ncbi:MAG: hypothetical protein HC853_06885 [Anaerolineae bacterium]|nr:hypothetical protein [Anaerolineae bacterium]